jgi:hypothetical protein
LVNGIRNVVPKPGNVGEAQIENLGVVLAGKIENGIGVGHKAFSQAATIGRVEQESKSLKPAAKAGNSIVLIAGIKRTLYLSFQPSALSFQTVTARPPPRTVLADS